MSERNRGPYWFTEAEWDRLSAIFLANCNVGLGDVLDQRIFDELIKDPKAATA